MATPTKWGSEFLVNTITNAGQNQPAITKLAGGGFVATWADLSQTLGDDSNFGGAVHGQVFNADGSKSGAEFLVNTTTDGSQFAPKVTALANGNFIAVWDDAGNSGADIRAQIFGADGAKVGSEFIVNATTADIQAEARVAVLNDGRFVVSWSDHSSGGYEIKARIFNADGTAPSAEINVNTTKAGNQFNSQIAALTDGRFAVAWQDESNPANIDVRVQIFNADGTTSGPELIANDANIHSDQQPAITALAGGRFVVAWSDFPFGSFGDVTAQIFDFNGKKLDPPFLVNTTTVDEQSSPALATLADGRFVATWVDHSGGNHNIRAQVFEANGAKSGSEFLVNTATANDQTYPTISVLADGRFVVAWSDQSNTGGDQDGGAVHAQIFDPRESAVNLNGGALNDDWVGTKFEDIMKGGGGADRLAGAGGLDTLAGGDGNDTLIGGAGNDVLRGDGGDDNAVFAQTLAQSSAYDYGNKIMVWGTDGLDTVIDVEHLQFMDGTVNVDDGSALFDTLFYMKQNLDVFHAGANALDHFNTMGWHEGRNPNAFFDTTGYLAFNKDVAAGGQNPLDHYHNVGWHEGRDPSAGFDTTLYLIHNPDVAAAGVDPLEHYLRFGFAEGRQAYEAVGSTIVNGFDAQYYLFHNPDVAAAGADPLNHYLTAGWHEGRNPNAWFDNNGYLSHYADVAASGINPLQHYEQFGWHEGRDPSASFDTLKYLAANADVAAAEINPLDHFLQNGIYEGRSSMGDGLWH